MNKEDVLKRLAYTKFMLLITPSYKRQKYIDNLDSFIKEYVLEFDKNSIKSLKKQLSFLTEEDCDVLYHSCFSDYKLLKFGKTRLKVDEYHPEDCRTFAQFNSILRIAFLAIDYEDNLRD